MLVVPIGIGLLFGVLAGLLPSRVAKMASGSVAASLVWGYRSVQAAESGDLSSWFIVLSAAVAGAAFTLVWFLAVSFKKAKTQKA